MIRDAAPHRAPAQANDVECVTPDSEPLNFEQALEGALPREPLRGAGECGPSVRDGGMNGSGGARQDTAKVRVLELGCGFAKTPGAFGIDIIPGSQADLLHDLDVFPYPLEDDAWDRIICRDVLEHVADFVRTMEEIWRVAAPGAIVEVRAPFMSSVNYFSDPTHRRAFTSRSFDYFLDGRPAHRLGYSKARFALLSCEYDAEDRPKRRGLHRWAVDWANRNKTRYEERYAFLYPVFNIYFTLRVVK